MAALQAAKTQSSALGRQHTETSEAIFEGLSCIGIFAAKSESVALAKLKELDVNLKYAEFLAANGGLTLVSKLVHLNGIKLRETNFSTARARLCKCRSHKSRVYGSLCDM